VFADERGQFGLAFFLFLVLVGMMVGGIYMIDRLGLVDFRSQLYKQLESVPMVGEYVAPSPISREEYKIQQLRELSEKLDERRSKIEQRKERLEQREEELEQKRRRIDRQEEQILEREQALAQRKERFDDEESRIQYLADLYSNMPPEPAAQRLQNIQEDRVVISVLREMPNQNSAIIMTNMDDQRAAVLSRKMAHYP
jgi:flagellar motility protein MotE (MotC chaperone)